MSSEKKFKTPPNMQYQSARLASFEPIQKPKSRSKVAFPLTASSHPYLTPESLAHAGFYHTPGGSSNSYDSCTCFLCGLELGGWDPEDDPHVEHVKRGGCSWADIVCQAWVDKTRRREMGEGSSTSQFSPQTLPSSAESAALREQTFQKWWPHKGKSGIPTAKDVARGGFIYNPSEDSKDSAMCPLCEYSLEGWEAGDDPLEIHRSKNADCRFFTVTLQGADDVDKPSKASTRSIKSQASKRSKRTTTAPSVAESAVEEDIGLQNQVDEEEEEPEPKLKKATKPRSTTKARGGKKKKGDGEAESLAEAELVEDAEIQAGPEPVDEADEAKSQPKSKGKAKPRTTKASSKKKKHDEESAAEEPEPSQAAEMEGSEIDAEQEPTPRPSQKATTSKPSSRVDPKPSSQIASKPSSQSAKPPSARLSHAPSTQPNKPPSNPSKPSSRSNPSKPSSTISQPKLSQPKHQSELEKFAHIPPSSPIPSPHSRSRPNPVPRAIIDSSLNTGATEARKVLESIASSPALNTINVPKIATGINDEEMSKPLGEDLKSMTLEQLVRFEFQRRHEEMRREGEEMIGRWEERTAEGRKRIQAI